MKGRFYFLLIILFSIVDTSLKAQNGLEDFLDTYVDDNTEPYLRPLFELITSDLNSATREWSQIDTSFYIRVGIVVMNGYTSSKQKKFTAQTGEGFEPSQTAEAPTIIGDINTVKVNGINGTSYVFPGGYNIKNVPFAAPQLTIGGFLNSEFSARYFAFDVDDEFGNVSLLGLGLRHSLNPYLKNLPFNLSIGYYFNNMKEEKYIDLKSHLISAHLGKSGKMWSAQLMLGYQKSTADITYEYFEDEEQRTKKLSIENENNFIAEFSAGLKLWIFKIHAGVGYSSSLTVAGGLCLEF